MSRTIIDPYKFGAAPLATIYGSRALAEDDGVEIYHPHDNNVAQPSEDIKAATAPSPIFVPSVWTSSGKLSGARESTGANGGGGGEFDGYSHTLNHAHVGPPPDGKWYALFNFWFYPTNFSGKPGYIYFSRDNTNIHQIRINLLSTGQISLTFQGGSGGGDQHVQTSDNAGVKLNTNNQWYNIAGGMCSDKTDTVNNFISINNSDESQTPVGATVTSFNNQLVYALWARPTGSGSTVGGGAGPMAAGRIDEFVMVPGKKISEMNPNFSISNFWNGGSGKRLHPDP
jgi:hypothetical protein